MAEVEVQNIHEIIDKGIQKAMRPIQWAFGVACVIITCFVGVMSWPVIDKVYSMESRVTIIEEKKVNSDELYRNFMTKNNYHIMQEEEHRYDVEAILNPKLCHEIYRESDRFRARQLEITNRGYN